MFKVESFLISGAGKFTGFEARRISSHNAQFFFTSFLLLNFHQLNTRVYLFVGICVKSNDYYSIHRAATGLLPLQQPLLIRKNKSFNNKEYNYEMSFKKGAFTKNVHSTIMANS